MWGTSGGLGDLELEGEGHSNGTEGETRTGRPDNEPWARAPSFVPHPPGSGKNMGVRTDSGLGAIREEVGGQRGVWLQGREAGSFRKRPLA